MSEKVNIMKIESANQDNEAAVKRLLDECELPFEDITSQLAESIEQYARSMDIVFLHTLTTTAEKFFEQRGYKKKDRDQAPVEIQGTNEFSTLCPASAIYMVKQLV